MNFSNPNDFSDLTILPSSENPTLENFREANG